MDTWEEKNLTKQKKSCSNNSGDEVSDSMREIKSGSTPSAWKDIGGIRMWHRKCPRCDNDIWVKSKKLVKSHCLCKACGYELLSQKKKIIQEKRELKRKCPRCSAPILYKSVYGKRKGDKINSACKPCQNLALSITNAGKSLSEQTKKKISLTMAGRVFSEASRKKLSRSKKELYSNNPDMQRGNKNPMYGVFRYGKDNPNYGKKWSEQKKREARIKSTQLYIQRGWQFHNYNKWACKYFDQLSKTRNWKLIHAENGGEVVKLGYFLDAYDEIRNIVVEYDEPHHYSGGVLKPKDVRRMNELIKYLNCQFYRYNQSTHRLVQYSIDKHPKTTL